MVAPLTGPFTSTGKQVVAGAQFYLQQNGNTVAGKRIELIIKDDAGIADQTRRLVQELIVNDKVNAIAGFGLTPLALAAAPLATQSKTPDDRHGSGDIHRDRTLTLYRPHELRAGAAGGRDR